MWSRIEIKRKAQFAVKKNYWKSVLMAFILLVLGGGVSGFSGSVNTEDLTNPDSSTLWGSIYQDVESYLGTLSPIEVMTIMSIVMFTTVIIVVVAVLAEVLLINPAIVGIRRYFIKAVNDEEAKVSEIGYGFDHSYKNIMATMFFRDLFTILWTCLFIIPGIVKSYEYRMIPYILAENPTLDKETAFALSREMMMGNKWRAFVFDLSFIGWAILSALTFGLVQMFYYGPYYYLAAAELYNQISFRFKNQPQ